MSAVSIERTLDDRAEEYTMGWKRGRRGEGVSALEEALGGEEEEQRYERKVAR